MIDFLSKACFIFMKFLFKLFYTVRYYGLPLKYPNGAIIASNHTSFWDPFVLIIGLGWRKDTHYLADRYVYDNRYYNILIRPYTFSLSNTTTQLRAVKIICDYLKKDYKVVIFPEGERSRDGKLKKLKHGVAWLALRCQCAIIPVYIHGTYEIWPRDRFFPRLSGKIDCIFGSPIVVDLESIHKKDAQKDLTDRLEKAISGLYEWYLDGAKGSPP